MTLEEAMEKDLRAIMRSIREHRTAEVFMGRRKNGVLHLRETGRQSERLATYALTPLSTFEEVADMIREDVAHALSREGMIG